MPQRGRLGSGSWFQVCSCSEVTPTLSEFCLGHPEVPPGGYREGGWSSLEVRYLCGHHEAELQSSRESFLTPFCSSFLLLPLFLLLNSGKKMRSASQQPGQDEHTDVSECHKELWDWTTPLTHLPPSQGPSRAVKREYLGEAPAHGRSWLLPPTTSTFASPLVLPQVPTEKTDFKGFNPPSSCFGWLVSLMLSDHQSCDQCHYLGQMQSQDSGYLRAG